MKFTDRILLIASLGLLSPITLSAPPPGHPSPDEAGKILRLPEQQTQKYQGVVVQAINSNAYTYIQVKIEEQNLWLAAPRIELREGQKIRFAQGRVMQNFYSRKLKITFPTVMFVSRVELMPEMT